MFIRIGVFFHADTGYALTTPQSRRDSFSEEITERDGKGVGFAPSTPFVRETSGLFALPWIAKSN
ncbi:MAG: hypothetical protein ACTHYC_06915 [Sphingobacterium sp.]